MHEAAIAKYVKEIIDETFESDDNLRGKSLKKITFALSRPYVVSVDSFEFYFVELIKGTPYEGARLTYENSQEVGFFVSSLDVD